nr:MFS transporter [Agilicoccus flavus]
MSEAVDERESSAGGRGRMLSGPVLAWAAWDWGSAAFNAVVTTFVFTVYLTSSAFGPESETSAALGAGLAAAGLGVALLAPVLGQRADATGRPTFWLGVNSLGVFVCTAALFFVRPEPGFLWLGVALVAVGTLFSEFAGVTYNAMLPRVSTPENVGRVSGLGWGVGYLGGIVLLAMLLVGFISPDPGWFGVTHAGGEHIRVAMLLAAAWFGLAALPVLFVVRDSGPAAGTRPDRLPGAAPRPARFDLVGSYRALWATIRGLWRSDPQLLRFLLAAAVYRDGLAGVFTFGGVIAAGTFGFTASQVIVFGIAANVVAGIATIVAGLLDDRLGAKRVIVVSLVAMCGCGLGLFAFHGAGPAAFWALGLPLAAFVGPAQSASRSLLSRHVPEGRHGEIFGLYTTTGRAVSFLAPAAFSAAVALGAALVGPQSQYWGVVGLVLVLLVGLLLFLPVRLGHTD